MASDFMVFYILEKYYELGLYDPLGGNCVKSPKCSSIINIRDFGNKLFGKRKWKLGSIPLGKIIFDYFDPSKYEYNKRLIKITGEVIPITVKAINKNQKYILKDGNHRCYCCKELGYTHIPAFMPNSIKDTDILIMSNI
jgi:hypothetical protein